MDATPVIPVSQIATYNPRQAVMFHPSNKVGARYPWKPKNPSHKFSRGVRLIKAASGPGYMIVNDSYRKPKGDKKIRFSADEERSSFSA